MAWEGSKGGVPGDQQGGAGDGGRREAARGGSAELRKGVTEGTRSGHPARGVEGSRDPREQGLRGLWSTRGVGMMGVKGVGTATPGV